MIMVVPIRNWRQAITYRCNRLLSWFESSFHQMLVLPFQFQQLAFHATLFGSGLFLGKVRSLNSIHEYIASLPLQTVFCPTKVNQQSVGVVTYCVGHGFKRWRRCACGGPHVPSGASIRHDFGLSYTCHYLILYWGGVLKKG